MKGATPSLVLFLMLLVPSASALPPDCPRGPLGPNVCVEDGHAGAGVPTPVGTTYTQAGARYTADPDGTTSVGVYQCPALSYSKCPDTVRASASTTRAGADIVWWKYWATTEGDAHADTPVGPIDISRDESELPLGPCNGIPLCVEQQNGATHVWSCIPGSCNGITAHSDHTVVFGGGSSLTPNGWIGGTAHHLTIVPEDGTASQSNDVCLIVCYYAWGSASADGTRQDVRGPCVILYGCFPTGHATAGLHGATYHCADDWNLCAGQAAAGPAGVSLCKEQPVLFGSRCATTPTIP